VTLIKISPSTAIEPEDRPDALDDGGQRVIEPDLADQRRAEVVERRRLASMTQRLLGMRAGSPGELGNQHGRPKKNEERQRMILPGDG
jgi:hypothetical protein